MKCLILALTLLLLPILMLCADTAQIRGDADSLFTPLIRCRFDEGKPESLNRNKGGLLSIEQLADELTQYDVIFFGEYHDNAILHRMEFDLLKALYEKNPNLAVSMEMFERDVQRELSKYMQGIITEESFLENSRPWNNYRTDYRPLIEFAKEKRLHVIAANVPRRLAAEVSRGGMEAFEAFPEKDKRNAARKLNAPDDDYKKRFMNTMSGGMHPMGKLNKEFLYMAQCLKDDTMAESIANHREQFPEQKIIHFNGDFHSNSYLGTVSRLATLMPELKIAVITPVPKLLEDVKFKMGDYLIMLESEPGN